MLIKIPLFGFLCVHLTNKCKRLGTPPSSSFLRTFFPHAHHSSPAVRSSTNPLGISLPVMLGGQKENQHQNAFYQDMENNPDLTICFLLNK
jgi:hypothetical protein